jgi:MFS transporter, FLVCR family, MFS-domain-containing protein 7
MGYSADVSGFMGACLLLSGMLMAIVTTPIIDRFFSHHLARISKVLVPFIAVGWLSLIWAGMSSLLD